MALAYSDREIAELLQERKPLPPDWRNQMRLRPKRGHNEQQLQLAGDQGNEFHLILRQNTKNPLDFSIVLAVRVPQSNQLFRLRRHNGKSHEHTNHIEDTTFYDSHIHFAAERYQEIGTREDAYAELTDRYGDSHRAFHCLIDDTSLYAPSEAQRSLFEGV